MRLSTSHRTTRQLGTALLVSMTLGLGLTACKSSPEAQDEAAQNQPITLSGPEDLLQTEDTLLAVRVNFGGELPDAIRSLEGATETKIVADLLENPVTFFMNEPNVQVDLSALDTERPVYVTLSNMGNEDFLDAAALGLPTLEEEWPTFALYRALIPTDDPALMTTQFDALVANYNADQPRQPLATRSFEGPGFLRVEIAALMNASRLPDGDRLEHARTWLNALDLETLALPTAGAFRPTTAYNAFLKAESELAVWTRFEAMAYLGILEASMSAQANTHQSAGESGLARFRLENISRLATASVVADPVAAENEDISLHLDADETRAITLDVVMTRTSQGSRVQQNINPAVSLPAIEAVHFLALDWSLNLANLADTTIAPFWELDYQGGTSSGFDSLDGNELRSRLSSYQLATPVLIAAGQYPMAWLQTSLQALGQNIPLPVAGSVRAYVMPKGGSLPVGGASTLLFRNDPGVRDQLQQLLALGQSAIPTSFDAALIERDDNHIELRLNLGGAINESFADAEMVDVQETLVDFNVANLGPLAGFLPGDTTQNLRRFALITRSSDEAQIIRVGINTTGELEAPTFAGDAPLLTAPTFRCRTELASAAFAHLEDLGTNAGEKADTYLSTFSERADRCIEPTHPYAAQAKARLDMARQWAAQLEASSPSAESVD
ncbi:hypothetical protein DV096_09870 [Bradymonadaceae bacterium TMQ3]|uniref:Uncharacterized protein n=1 Tax=Lujinxingia sediminis TaxID=2480984 RepID=A0ABY0CPG2_9DELT|nr:hypothetical protein [Lujinxingia sediminis]RDV38112.1 hypothetical protein DV096_09870 [Bradymonadaceae bacterium TMQ3]RVU42218.1 hypothetical protein EA187_16660 [Lujinxingia sediminis]TXC75784.1 hypothetical protein FRC91_09780 [Bradymonadales bacterium TMQ1]